MAKISRNDGIQFVIQAYRELIKYRKIGQLRQRIIDISKQQGSFVHLYKRQPGEYEAVFTSETGYLFAESIKQYFQQTKNLIFCEALKEKNQLLLVIIKEGNVFADTYIARHQLQEELVPLLALKTKFQVVVAGDLGEENQAVNNPLFPEELILSYENLEESLLERLPALANVKLLPLPFALKAEHINNRSFLRKSPIAILSLLSLIGVLFYALQIHHQKKLIDLKKEKMVPYADYIAAMSSPSPAMFIQATSDLIKNLFELPGWSAESIIQTRDFSSILLKGEGGTLNQVQKWANYHHYKVELTSQGILIKAYHNWPPRPPVSHLAPLTELSEFFIDTLQKNILDSHLQLLQKIPHRDTQEILFTLNLENFSLQQFDILKDLFSQLPIVLNQIKLSVNEDALLRGAIQFSIWGK